MRNTKLWTIVFAIILCVCSVMLLGSCKMTEPVNAFSGIIPEAVWITKTGNDVATVPLGSGDCDALLMTLTDVPESEIVKKEANDGQYDITPTKFIVIELEEENQKIVAVEWVMATDNPMLMTEGVELYTCANPNVNSLVDTLLNGGTAFDEAFLHGRCDSVELAI